MTPTEKQIANLCPVLTKSEARERGRNGGLAKKANEPKRKLEQLKKEAFKEVAQEMLWEVQGFSLKQMCEWVKTKLVDIDNLSTSELEKIQKFLEFLRDSSGQKPSDKQEITNINPDVVVETIEMRKKSEDYTKKLLDD
jgi:Ribonuclease G/E